ncbi:MAG: phosphate/phosphite/phosphonate ABC transporter substrate-binding protein [Caldilineae bacterium]|nr:MAG: phosphate/phosphite/phosphonate ABC transporter substrate-binding protein [Caldilineae bacterium]
MRNLYFSLLLVVGVVLLAGCGSREPTPYVRLQVEAPAEVAGEELAPGKLPLRVAVAAVLSPEATFEVYGPLLEALSQALDRPVELLQRSTYAEINELIRTGAADIAFICGGAFVEGEHGNYMELLVAPKVEGEVTYRSLVLVPADSPAQSLEDLRGKRFAFTDPLSNSGRLYITYWLRQRGESPDTFFKETIFTYSHDNSVRAVADGIVDGAAVDSLVYSYLSKEEPELARRTRVLHSSPDFGIPPVVVHPDLDPVLKAQLRQALVNMNRTSQGRAALRALHVDGFTVVSPTLYDDIRTMAAALRGWTVSQGN